MNARRRPQRTKKKPARPKQPSRLVQRVRALGITARAAIEGTIGVGLLIAAITLGFTAWARWQYRVAITEAQHAALAGHDASRAMKVALTASSRDPLALALGGLVALRRDDAETARDRYTRAGGVDSDIPQVALASAVAALLTDRSADAATTARAVAERLISDGELVADANALLGQLALNAGEFADAEARFRAALAGDAGTDQSADATDDEADARPVPPHLGFAVVATNGLGLCLVEQYRRSGDVEALDAAITAFGRACAYRQAWAAPYENRDRANALRVMQACRTHADDLNVLEARARQVDDVYVSFTRSRHANALKAVALTASRPTFPLRREGLWPSRRVLFNAVAVLDGCRAVTMADDAQRRKRLKRIDDMFAVADGRAHPDNHRSATIPIPARLNGLATLLRQIAVRPGGLNRKRDVRAAYARLVEWRPTFDVATLAARDRAAWVVADLVVSSLQEDPLELVVRLVRDGTLDEIAAYADAAPAGAPVPDPSWVAVLRYHLGVLDAFQRLSAEDRTLAAGEAFVAAAAELARHLPPSDASTTEAAGLLEPIEGGGAPRLDPPRRLTVAESLLPIRAYEALLRDFDETLQSRVADAVREAPETVPAMVALRAALTRVRLRFTIFVADAGITIPRGHAAFFSRVQLRRMLASLSHD